MTEHPHVTICITDKDGQLVYSRSMLPSGPVVRQVLEDEARLAIASALHLGGYGDQVVYAKWPVSTRVTSLPGSPSHSPRS